MNSVTEAPLPATVDDLLRFINDRAIADELSQITRAMPDRPDRYVLHNCEIAAWMVQHTRDSDAWERHSWRSALLEIAERHHHHPDFQQGWYALSRPSGLVA